MDAVEEGWEQTLCCVLSVRNGFTNNAQVLKIFEGCRTLDVQDVRERGRVLMLVETTRSRVGSKSRCVGGSRTVLLLGICAGL